MRKNSVGSVSIRADGQIWLDDRPTPYAHTRSADGVSDFWRMEDPYFGTRFKRLGLNRRIYSDADEKALHGDILEAMDRDGFDSVLTQNVMNLVGRVTGIDGEDWMVCFDEGESGCSVRVNVNPVHRRLSRSGKPLYVHGEFLSKELRKDVFAAVIA